MTTTQTLSVDTANNRLLDAYGRRLKREVPFRDRNLSEAGWHEDVPGGLLSALEDFARSQGYPVQYVSQARLDQVSGTTAADAATVADTNDLLTWLKLASNPFKNADHGDIYVLKTMSDALKFDTLAHEVTHVMLHQNFYARTSRDHGDVEIEAQSGANAITSAFGVRHVGSSADYLISWTTSGGRDIWLIDAMDRIKEWRRKVRQIVTGEELRSAEETVIAEIKQRLK
jgi:hypothetical protein